MEEESQKFKSKKTKIIIDNSYKNKSPIKNGKITNKANDHIWWSDEFTKYVLVKIFLKTLNDFIKMEKYTLFAYQQIQIEC